MSFIIQQFALAQIYPSASRQGQRHQVADASTPSPSVDRRKESQNIQDKLKKEEKQIVNSFSSLEQYSLQSNINITLRKLAIYNPHTSHLYYTLKLILNQQKYIKISNRERQLFFFKSIAQKIIVRSQQNITVAFHPQSGMVKIVLFNGFMIISNALEGHLIDQVKKFYKFDHLKQYLLSLLTGAINSSNFALSQGIHSNANVRSIQKILPKIGTGLIVSCNNRAESSIMKGYTEQKARIQKTLNNLMNLTQTEALQLSLYCKNASISNRSEIFFNQHELTSISNKIKAPTLVKCKNLFQNNCILNFIKINNSQQLRLTKISSGGFSSIFFTEIQYWYVFSGSENELIAPPTDSSFSRENMFKKAVIFKKEESKPSQSRSRVLHQKDILKKIKNGNAIFVPKYYIPLNEPSTNKTLFCDYISNPNLSEYMYLHRETLSPVTKTLILLMLIHGISFLSDYEVFHLDLKPHNIMITKSMMVKIIDFGESYHHLVCNDDFIPGFTMPYSAPESYYPVDSNSFSSKNDIFSLGVIASELMNARLPFYFFNEENHFERYTQSNFQDFWFYSPEEYEDRSDPFIFGFMQLVIGRCMDVRAERRPDLNWLCLIFREFLDFYY